MKTASLYIIFIFGLISTTGITAGNVDKDIAIVFDELQNELQIVNHNYNIKANNISRKLVAHKTNLSKTSVLNEQVQILVAINNLEDIQEKSKNSYISDISKIRYLKGLQIIKILYEKTLSLDHHFSSVATLNEINRISNPNNYSEFQEVKTTLVEKRDKKSGFNISSLLGNNIYTSVIHSFVSLFTDDKTEISEKEANLKDIECILDFTLRMHNDLNTIYFETVFLQKNNESVMKELEQLFTDYTQPIHYKTPLKECRQTDDWGIVREQLNTYLEKMEGTIKEGKSDAKVRSMQINLQFPIDRLLQFITQYNAFIDQGSKFYEKFGIMLNSYENEQQCSSKIPAEYQTMKNNIALSIEKFNTAYKPIEINGSKLKQLLYGINEYE